MPSGTSTAQQVVEAVAVVPAPDNEAVLERLGIPARARVISDIRMRSSAQLIPDPLEAWENPANLNLKPEGWWLAEGAAFDGNASYLNRYEELSAPEHFSADNATVAFCVTKDGRLLGILSPNVPSEPSVWIATACAHVQVRPDSDSKSAGVTIAGDGWKVQVGELSRLYRSLGQKSHTGAKLAASALAFGATDILIIPGGGRSGATLNGRYETGQTRSFVQAVATGAGVTPPYEFTKPDGPARGQGYRWIQEPGLGGLYRLERKGEPTTATWLVDRERPVDEQLDALEKIDWLPRAWVDHLAGQTRDGTLPKLFIPELPAGRVNQPLSTVYLGVIAGDEPARHPVSRYLWPSLQNGVPSLDAGEEVLFEAKLTRAKLSRANRDTAASGSELGSKGTTEARIYVTNQRVIAVARRSPEGVRGDESRRWWASHFRHEWIYEVGMHEETAFKRTLLRARPKPGSEQQLTAPYVRMWQVYSCHELLLIDLNDPAFVTTVVEAVLAAGPERTASQSRSEHDAMHFRTQRTAQTISDPTPYSLPARIAS